MVVRQEKIGRIKVGNFEGFDNQNLIYILKCKIYELSYLKRYEEKVIKIM